MAARFWDVTLFPSLRQYVGMCKSTHHEYTQYVLCARSFMCVILFPYLYRFLFISKLQYTITMQADALDLRHVTVQIGPADLVVSL